MVTKLFLVFVAGVCLLEQCSTIEVVDVSSEPGSPENVCNCKDVDIVSNRDVVLRKHGDVLGRYTKIEAIPGGQGTPAYVHFSGKFFLYYSTQSQVN